MFAHDVLLPSSAFLFKRKNKQFYSLLIEENNTLWIIFLCSFDDQVEKEHLFYIGRPKHSL